MGKAPVADHLIELLTRYGVTTAFGIISIHNIPLLDAMGRSNAIRFISGRGEAGCGHMADGYARISDGLGVLITSTGPGAANAVGALVEARFAGTPLLHITSQTATSDIESDRGTVHEVPDQLAMLRSVSKAAYRVRSADGAIGVLARAAAEALTPPRGPVSVEIPIDLQRALIERPAALDHMGPIHPAPAVPDPAQLDRAVDMLAGSRRPVLWLGNGAKHAGPEALRLLELGVGLVTSWAGRGVVSEDHPMSLGALNGSGTPDVETFYDTVDTMVVVGSRLRGHETRDGALRLPSRRIHVDINPMACGRSYTSDLFVVGDSALALAGLADRLSGRLKVDPKFRADIDEVRRKAKDRFRGSLGAYSTFPDQLREAMPRDAIFVRDITISHTTWSHRMYPVFGPDQSVYPVGAAIGAGLPLAIGSALAAGGRRVLAMCGDGGFALNLGEVWTAVQEKADLTIVIMNDGGYGVIKQIQETHYGGRKFYGDVAGPNFKDLAKLAQIPFWRVDRADQFGKAVSEALAAQGPNMIEVDMVSIGPAPTASATVVR